MDERGFAGQPGDGTAGGHPSRSVLVLAGGVVLNKLAMDPLPGTEPATPLVLVPGVAGSADLFRDLIPHLAATRRTIAVDLAPRAQRGSNVIDSSAAMLREVLDAEGPGPMDLLGQSFGAIVAVRLWRAWPERVRRLVLAAPATVPAGPGGISALLRWAAMGTAVRLWPREHRQSLRRWVRWAGGYPIEPALSGPGLDALAERVRRTRVRPLVRRLLAVARHSWARELDGVTPPVLVIEGDLEAPLLPRRLLEHLRRRPGTRLAIVPGGHMPFLVQPEGFAAAVLDFLDGAPPGGRPAPAHS